MKTSHTPTAEEVKKAYHWHRYYSDPRFRYSSGAWEEFDRWLSELIRKEREEAVDRYAAQVIEHIEKYGTTVDVQPWPENPYRKE